MRTLSILVLVCACTLAHGKGGHSMPKAGHVIGGHHIKLAHHATPSSSAHISSIASLNYAKGVITRRP